MSQQFDIVGNLLLKVDGAEAGLNKLKNSLSQLKMPANLDSNLKKSFSNLDGLFAKYKAQLKDGFNTKGDVTSFAKTGKQIEAEYDRIAATVSKLTGKDISFKVDLTTIQNLEKEIERVVTLKEKLSQDIKGGLGLNDYLKAMQASDVGRRGTKVFDASNMLQTSLGRGDIEKAKTDVEGLISELNRMSDARKKALEDRTGIAFNQIITELRTKVTDADQAMNKFGNDIKTTSDNIAQIRADGVDKVTTALNEAVSGTDKAQSGFKQLNGTAQETANSMLSMTKQVEQLQQSTQYFFSLRNMINLFKRGIDDAVQSVKELDKAMTDTAVVTDYNISDLWGMLPEYTQIANELGATTQGAYETMTLYFQQGLDQQQAFEIGAETMKMARIAGLDYADATDMMTAALRGFNMELNETSAQRINDVYSKLAAVTASDTEELGTAMQRTASIAHSAGMSFEGTTAFLAQAIETTREPAENLGTAMKTIIARFQELKKNPLEIGEVEGEEVDYNKVDTALQSIGVSLKDTNGQFRDLDKVFLDISQRWDSLSQTQQRYIATTAAGSRQQSRFIAMMSNYSRTMELMDAANNSAGASEEQFGKTMDSLEAKINKLHNAWQQFTMGIANNGMIKMAVDGITGLLTVTNKLIDTFSLGIGPVKSLLSLLMAFTGLKAAGRVANSMIGGLGGLLDPQSSFFKGAKNGFIKNTDSNAQAHAISNPIVQAIHQLQAALTGKTVTNNNQGNTTANYQAFKAANLDLRTLLKESGTASKLSLSSIYGKIGNLDDKQQTSILRQLPGLQLNLKRDGIQFDTSGLKGESLKLVESFTKEVNQGLKNNTISSKDAINIFGTPENFKQAMEARGPEYAKAASEVLFDSKYYQQQYDKYWSELNVDDNYIGHLGSEEALEARTAELQAQAKQKASIDAETKALSEFNKRATITQTKGALIANSIGNVGTAAMTAGQGIAQLGMQLSNAGFDTAGAAVTNLGYQISSLGQIAASAGNLIGKITDAGGIGGLLSAHPYVAAAGVAIAAVGGIIALAKAQEKHAREAAEKTVKTYTDIINETTEKVSTLNSAKDVFNQLSKGVDEYGNNIGLTTDEYDQYLQTSQEVAQIAPELIRGYDAQGRAIIATGAAIDKLITKQEDLQNSARDTFVSDSSINDLVSGIRVSDAFKNNSKNVFGDNLGYLQKQTGALKKALQSVGVEEFDAATKQLFGREINLINPSSDDLRLISEHYGDIYRLIESKNQDLTDRQKEGLQNAFADLGSGWKDMSEELQPLSQAISQYLSSEGLDTIGLNLGEEFTGAFNAGLQDLTMTAAMENWDASEIKATAREYAEGFKEMTQEGSEYANIMEKVTAEQEKYDDVLGEAGTIDNYKAAVEDYATELENLADKYDDGTVAGQLFANSLRETAGHIRNYATESVVSLGEAINTLSDEFASARGAQERFQEATKDGDYYTAAEGYKGIIDTVLDEKNVAGQGSLTGWAGAEELLGRTFTDNHSWDEIVSQIKRIQDCFADGSDGVLAFNDLLVENQDKLKGLGYAIGDDWHFDLQTEDLAEYAEVLGMSEEALAGLIDKARQWVPFDLGDPTKIRQALEASEYSMQGTSSKGENLLYTSESEFREEAREQGIRGNDYTKTKTDAESQGIRFLTVENLTAKNGDGLYADKVLENIGLKGADKTLDNAVAALAKMGFDLEDTKQILTADGLKLADGQATAEAVEQSYNEQAYALENPTVAGIANDTGIIASAATAMLASMGILTDEAKKDIEQSTSKDTVNGAIQTLNPEGGFKTAADHDVAVAQVQSQIADYESTINLLKQSGNDALLPQIQQLEAARNSLQQAVDNDMSAWQTKLEGAKSYVEGIGKTVQEQSFLDAHAFDIQEALQSSDPTALVTTLQQLQQEGNLSSQTMLDLGASLSHLEGNETYIKQLNTLMSQYYESVKAARDETYKPFTITSKLEGDNLIDYVSKIDTETINQKEREILVSAELYGDEKVSAFLDEINDNLEGGNETTKTVLIEATAKVANGDTAGANELLQNAFGEDKAQEIETQLEIICDGSVANPSEVQQAIESEISNLKVDTEVQATVQANVKATYTNKKPKVQNGTINYKTGKIAPVEDQQATLNYKTGNIPPVPAQRTSLNFNLGNIPSIPDQNVNIYPKLKGSGTYTVVAHARGRNYSIPAHHSLSFGSAARGMNVPKPKKSTGKQVTALVGEEGFEVGYIPSEARSVIFGANGPEMTSFPKDTIIYPHKQSKEILRKGKGQHITAGSYQGGLDNVSSEGLRSSIKGSTVIINQNKNKNNINDKDTKKNNQDAKKNNKETTKVIKKAGNINAWWWNMGKKVESTQRIIDKTYKQIEKLIKKAGTTIDDLSEDGDLYIKKLNQQISLNTKMRNKADDKLTILDKGPSKASKEAKAIKKAQDRVDKAEKKVKKAKTAKEKAAAKDELKKAKKNLKKKQKTANYSTISYDVTTVKKDKKGKKTKSKKTKKQKVDLSKFIKYDEATEAYIIDYKKINSKNWDKSKKKAVMDAAQKKIEDYQKKRDTAEDNIDKAQEALEKFGAELYENFNAWENELTKIYFITQKIAETEKRISAAKTAQTLQENRLASGLESLSESFKQLSYKYFQVETHGTVRSINDRNEAISVQKQNTLDVLQGNDLKAQRSALYRQLASATSETDKARINAGIEELNSQLKVIGQAQQYIKPMLNSDGTIELNFNTEKFESDRSGNTLNAESAQIIQEYIKKVQEANSELLDLYEEQISSLNELYETLISLQEQYLDYSNQLLEAIEKEAEDRVNVIKSLSDSVSNSFKELIDKVKEQLDQRRREEDNAKTERDIVKKQNRLALLRANASGGNVVAAAQLEQEIAEAQQSYGRTLEDQLLDRLQNSNDKAEKQREAQIKLLEAQLELNKINGVNTKHVADLMDHPELYQSEITRLIKYSEDYNRQTREGQESINRKIQGILEGLDLQTGIPAKILDVKNEIREAEKSLEKTLKNYLDAAQKEAGVGNFNDAGTELAEELEKLSKQREELQQKLNDLNTKKETLQSQLSTARSDSSKKYNALQDAEHRMSSAHSQLNAARKSGDQQRINAAETRVSQATQEYNTAYAAWTEANKKEKTLQVQLNNIETQIKSVQTQLNTVNAQYNKTDQEYAATTGQVAPFDDSLTEEDKANLQQSKQNNYEDALKALRNKGSKFTYDDVKKVKDAANKAGIGARTYFPAIVAGSGSPTWKELLTLLKANSWSRYRLAATFTSDTFKTAYDKVYGSGAYKKNRDKALANPKDYPVYAYAKGGLANYTGPAWLDGTPSKPELVLDATDTKNLIALKDILSKVMKGSLTTTTENQGDILYEININVDKIEKDYDVDRVVSKVKQEIVKSAGYRNVTQVRNFR